MRTAISIALFALAVMCAIVIGNYLAALRVPDAGMALLGLQVMLLAVSVLTLGAGVITSLVYKSEPMRSAVAALWVGAIGCAVLALSYVL